MKKGQKSVVLSKVVSYRMNPSSTLREMKEMKERFEKGMINNWQRAMKISFTECSWTVEWMDLGMFKSRSTLASAHARASPLLLEDVLFQCCYSDLNCNKGHCKKKFRPLQRAPNLKVHKWNAMLKAQKNRWSCSFFGLINECAQALTFDVLIIYHYQACN